MPVRLCRLICVLILSCLLIAGCDLTLGPKTKTVYTVVHPGKPLQVLSQKVLVEGRLLNGEGNAVKQDIAGWIAMPLEHWEAVQRALEKKAQP